MSANRVLVIGSGGREHALVWKLSQECEVHAAPGNPGMMSDCHGISPDDHEGLVELCDSIKPDLVVVGPENPLILGLADRLRSAGFVVFGPNQGAARLEGSKAFSKDIMAAAGIPTAKYENCSSAAAAFEASTRFFDSGMQVAVKASGNALGKGVVVCDSVEMANHAIQKMMVEKLFGEAAETVVIEERLLGREYSLLTLCNEAGYWSLPVAQDYKRIFDGDQGPNTGGMGSYSPVDWLSSAQIEEAEALMVAPLLKELKNRGLSYRGVLFSGVMLTQNGPKCLEYNVRFGDPETQSVVRRLESGFFQALLNASTGEPIERISISNQAAVTLVIANAGYPGTIQSKPEIKLPIQLPVGVEIFHAGTKRSGDALIATGGRVLNISAVGTSIQEARTLAYGTIESIEFPGAQFRSDIGI